MEKEILQAKKKAMSILEFKDRTEGELREKLQRAEFSEVAVEEAIAYVKSYHYIDDERYAIRFVEYHMSTRSIQRLRQDLKKRYVPEEYIDLALENIQYNEMEGVTKALQKVTRSYTQKPSYEEKQKIIAKLYRKGFQLDNIHKAYENWLEDNNFNDY